MWFIRMTNIAMVVYGFRDASGIGFGSSSCQMAIPSIAMAHGAEILMMGPLISGNYSTWYWHLRMGLTVAVYWAQKYSYSQTTPQQKVIFTRVAPQVEFYSTSSCG
jgi:hypothetical protein